jgi:hypothetical protein
MSDMKFKSGAVNSTGAAQEVICGFKPRTVKLFLSGGASGFWNDDMADETTYRRIIAGTGSLITSDGITPTEKGFTLGADSLLNPSTSEVVYFEASQ